MAKNPKKALSALLPLPIRCGLDVVVKPMTLGMWAALERIDSPLIVPPKEGHSVDTLELIPSLYLLTHDPIEVFRGNILELSMAWADTVPVKTMDLIRQAAYRQMGAAFDVIPEPDQKAVKKKPTVSSPISPNGRPKPTTGRSTKSSGECRSRQSASSTGEKV